MSPAARVAEELRVGLEQAFTPKYLNLILLPTEECNFRCTYCYERFEHGRMAPAVLAGVKRLIARRAPDLDHLQVSWFGGEPLAAQDLVVDVGEYASNLVRHGSLKGYSADMTTNGALLTVSTASALTATGVALYHISLDGPAELHDQTRRARGGQGTFDRIWRNLIALSDSTLRFSVMLRLHVHPQNYSAVPRLVRLIEGSFQGDNRFTFYFAAIGKLGGTGDSTLSVLSASEKQDKLQALRDLVSEPEMLATPTGPGYVCYAARANSFVVRTDGTLMKCTVALYDDKNVVGRLSEDGTVQVDGKKMRPWLQGWETGDARALACPWKAAIAPSGSLLSELPVIN